MAIFRRDTPPTTPRPEAQSPGERTRQPEGPVSARRERAASAANVTLIAKGSRFIGKVSGPAEVVIEGEVEGEVALDGHVQIGTNGKVRGDMSVRSARIAGQLVGNVRGREVVELTATGKLEGDVSAPRVIIAEGAFFRGNIEMTGKKAPQQSRTVGAPESNDAQSRPQRAETAGGGTRDGGAPEPGAHSTPSQQQRPGPR